MINQMSHFMLAITRLTSTVCMYICMYMCMNCTVSTYIRMCKFPLCTYVRIVVHIHTYICVLMNVSKYSMCSVVGPYCMYVCRVHTYVHTYIRMYCILSRCVRLKVHSKVAEFRKSLHLKMTTVFRQTSP